jgi:hypothetical protein
METTVSRTTPNELWDEAKTWFNNMHVSDRNNLILTMYKLCLATKDTSHSKLSEDINKGWNEKMNQLNLKWTEDFGVQVNKLQKMEIENQIYKQKNYEGFDTLFNKLNNFEHKLENEINGLSLKISPSTNGKLGEDYIEGILSKIPGAKLHNVAQSKGNGDFLFEINDKKFMIISKIQL